MHKKHYESHAEEQRRLKKTAETVVSDGSTPYYSNEKKRYVIGDDRVSKIKRTLKKQDHKAIRKLKDDDISTSKTTLHPGFDMWNIN